MTTIISCIIGNKKKDGKTLPDPNHGRTTVTRGWEGKIYDWISSLHVQYLTQTIILKYKQAYLKLGKRMLPDDYIEKTKQKTILI